jgi:histidinol-phosphate aminotransferase
MFPIVIGITENKIRLTGKNKKMNNFNIQNLIRENIKIMKPYSSARDEFKEFDQQMIFLDANENPFENGVNRYPDPQQRAVKSALSEIKRIDQEQILLGNGSDEVLDLVFRAFCEPNKDNIVTLPPTYGMYSVLASLNAIKNREVLLTDDFDINVDAILSRVDDHTKIIFLCSPNNPTGNSFSNDSIRELLEKFNGLVLLDEAYIDFSDNESWLQQLPIYPNLIISQTLSKAFGMAGIRLGILYASSEIIAILNKIKPPYNVNVLTQQKALERIENYDQILDEIIKIKVSKYLLISELETISYIQKVYPTDGNFILIKVDDANKRYHQALQKGIVLRNRSTQPLCENCIRITIGTQEENEQLIEILKKI